MEENRNINREENRADDDQLRPNTMNEAIREASGNPDADLNQLSSDRTTAQSDQSAGSADPTDHDQTLGVRNNPNDASATRSGGTTDMDDQAMGGAGLSAGERLGSGTNITTKRNVTGSDFDGQVKSS
jgi:hypothetical protein